MPFAKYNVLRKVVVIGSKIMFILLLLMLLQT